jgi:hypothetical protein
MIRKIKIFDQEWLELNAGMKKGSHEYHSFIFSTIRSNKPELRTVILRDINTSPYTISFHTGIRSQKIKDLKLNNFVSALFYDRKRSVQLRLSGSATIDYNNKITETVWASITPESKVCYMGPYPPSKKIEIFKPNLPEITPYEIDSEYEELGYARFCRITINIETIDWLLLHHGGHKRILFQFKKEVSAEWIAS